MSRRKSAASVHASADAITAMGANDRPVLLFDNRLVVLASGPAARELDAGVAAIVPNRLVHEHAVVVGVEPRQIQ